MSYDLDYFPPQGTKFTWHHKALKTSPWVLNMWDHWPASIVAKVDKAEGFFRWLVEVRTFNHGREVLKGVAKDALSACKAAERCCEREKKKLWLPWMETATKAGWRPPA